MNKMKMAERTKKIKPSPTLAVSAKANRMRAEGINVLSFGAGEPDFDTPGNIKEAAIRAIEEGFTKYTAVEGIDELKTAIIDKFRKDNNLSYEKSQIAVSCGAKHSLYNITQALFEKSDEVIIPAPYWVSYLDMVLLTDATPVVIETDEAGGFKITATQLENAITGATRALILNSPSNPTGAVYSHHELASLAEVLAGKDIVVISDDIYEKILYDGSSFCNIAGVNDEIRKKTIVVNGVSKTYAMTGWRIGYAAGPAEVISEVVKIQSQNTSNPTSIAQKAAVEALRGDQQATVHMVEEFRKRRDYIVHALNAIHGIECTNPTGAFYVFPRVSLLFGKAARGRTISESTSLSAYLLDEVQVAVVPGSAFGSDSHIRLSYATSMETIREGIERIGKALRALA